MTAADLVPVVVGTLVGGSSVGAVTFRTIYARLSALEAKMELLLSGKLRLG